MKILCVERDKARLRQMREEARELVPGAHITVCHDPFRAEAVAKAKGCDVLLTDTIFDGRSLDGVMLAEQIRLVNPRVNIIFITDYEDSLAAYDAWKPAVRRQRKAARAERAAARKARRAGN